MLLYRLPEAFLIKMIMPFLKDGRTENLVDGSFIGGGLELPTETIGVAYGTVGVIALLAGGILGGIYASRVGLKKALWPMAACMILPCLTFCYLAIFQPTNVIAIIIAIAIPVVLIAVGLLVFSLLSGSVKGKYVSASQLLVNLFNFTSRPQGLLILKTYLLFFHFFNNV